LFGATVHIVPRLLWFNCRSHYAPFQQATKISDEVAIIFVDADQYDPFIQQ